MVIIIIIWIEILKNDNLNKIDQTLLMLIKQNKYITIGELALKIGKSEPTIHRHIVNLTSKGMLVRVGSRKSGYWRVIK